jgi:hypothetical protein
MGPKRSKTLERELRIGGNFVAGFTTDNFPLLIFRIGLAHLRAETKGAGMMVAILGTVSIGRVGSPVASPFLGLLSDSLNPSILAPVPAQSSHFNRGCFRVE